MKNIFVFSIGLLLFFSACEKETTTVTRYQSTATLNESLDWTANSCWFNKSNRNENIYIGLELYNGYGELREVILFSGFELQLGTTPLNYQWRGVSIDSTDTARFNTFIADGDAVTESYDLFEHDTIGNFIHIDWISDDKKEITGSYELSFVISEDSPSKFDESRPDTLLFTNGIFRALQLE